MILEMWLKLAGEDSEVYVCENAFVNSERSKCPSQLYDKGDPIIPVGRCGHGGWRAAELEGGSPPKRELAEEEHQLAEV